MSELKDFQANLAIDPRKLGEFIHDPDAAMASAELSEDDKAAAKSGFPAQIHARLSGLPTSEAFKITLRPPQQFVFPIQMPFTEMEFRLTKICRGVFALAVAVFLVGCASELEVQPASRGVDVGNTKEPYKPAGRDG